LQGNGSPSNPGAEDCSQTANDPVTVPQSHACLYKGRNSLEEKMNEIKWRSMNPIVKGRRNYLYGEALSKLT